MSFVGFDVSSHAIDCVELANDSNDATWTSYPLGAGDALERLRRVHKVMPSRGWWRDRGAVLFALEAPKSRGYDVAAKLNRVFGAVVSCLPAEVQLLELAPTEWRKACGLAGNASKEDVFTWAVRRWPYTSAQPLALPQDAADAFCVSFAARALCEKAAAA